MASMKKSFQELIRSTVAQTERPLIRAEHIYRILSRIDVELETLNDLAARGRRKTQDRSDESLLIDLLDENNIRLDKNKENHQLLDRFPSLIRTNSNEMDFLINRFRTSLKSAIDQLPETASSLQYSPSFSSDE